MLQNPATTHQIPNSIPKANRGLATTQSPPVTQKSTHSNNISIEKANAIESLPSWHSPTENTLLFQAFEWHVPTHPNTPDKRSHWRRLQHALPAIHSLGVTTIWIPPGCKGMDANGNGYDIYDLYDLGEFDQKGAVGTKWGTRAELEDLVREASALGVGILWDAVLNHKAGADGVERFEGVRVGDDRISPYSYQLCVRGMITDTYSQDEILKMVIPKKLQAGHPSPSPAGALPTARCNTTGTISLG